MIGGFSLVYIIDFFRAVISTEIKLIVHWIAMCDIPRAPEAWGDYGFKVIIETHR
jgi:hypothetical protein